MVNESDAIEIMSIFRSKGIQIYLDGGWGVDALIGFESRCHNDIDIFIEKQDKECSIKLLNDNGYSETVMAYTTPEHTVWRDGNARIIDLHIFSRNSKGDFVFESETFPKEVFTGNGKSHFPSATNSMRTTSKMCCFFATNSILRFLMK